MSQSSTQPRRNEAVRVFAPELNASTIEFKDPGEIETEGKDNAPNYLLLATGDRANRVLMAGTLTDTTEVSDNTMRARIVDGGGETFFLYASQQYSKDAYADLQQIGAPEFLMVIGKPNTYTTDEGETYVSVDPENVVPVDSETRDRCVAETAEQTLDRLRAFEDGDAPHYEQAKEHYDYDRPELQDHVAKAIQGLKERDGELDEDDSDTESEPPADEAEVDPTAAAT